MASYPNLIFNSCEVILDVNFGQDALLQIAINVTPDNALTLGKWKYTDNYTDTLHYRNIEWERLIEEHKRKQCIKCKCLGYMQLRAISFIGQA